MKKIVNSAEMKQLDQNTIVRHGIPSLVLMERASLAVVEHLKDFDLTNVLAVCGPGNNGGDGIAVARLLHLSGISVSVYILGDEKHFTKECKIQKEIAESYHVPFVNKPVYSEYTTIIDGIFGVGLSRAVEGNYRAVIEEINKSDAKVAAVDIPSGINADNGHVMGCAIKADKTITFAYGKIGQNLYPGKSYCGECICCNIGIYEYWNVDERNQNDNILKNINNNEIYVLEDSDLKKIPKRKSDGNKGTFGKVLVVAGSKGMGGAAVLCARAVLRCGVGMVKVITHEGNRMVIQQSIPEAMTGTYETEAEAIQCLKEGLSWADTVVCGCGLGVSSCSEQMVTYLMKHCKKPMVLDADGLNIISQNLDLLKNRTCSTLIVTPHIGEMSRLTAMTISDIKNNPIKAARDFTGLYHVQCVMKDAVTCITVPSCDSNSDNSSLSTYLNGNGNSGMATAGSGDVLAGMIGGLLAVGTPYSYAGALGAYVHGACGTAAKERYGESFMTAGDMIQELQYLRLAE